MTRLPLDEAKVKELVRQCKHLNVFPIQLGYREGKKGKTGKSHPVYSLLEELIAEAIEYLGMMTDEEVRDIVDTIPRTLTNVTGRHPPGPYSHAVLDAIAEKYIIALVHERYEPFKDVFVTDLTTSEVLKIYPELRDKFDDEGLLKLDNSFRLSDGGIEYRDHVLHYHQLLRRGYYSQPNFDFLRAFIDYYREVGDENQFRIAIDHRRIMPKEYFQQLVEHDLWRGPSFDRAKLDDRNEVGLTVVKSRISGPMRRLFFQDLERTEFFWSVRGAVKTFQVEELSGEERVQESYYLNRYVHAERDIEQKALRHFDGAVKVYTKDEYPQRLLEYMPGVPRCFRKPKLFRIDVPVDEKGGLKGSIDVDRWIELTSLFFKGNAMLIEYFDPELYAATYKQYEE